MQNKRISQLARAAIDALKLGKWRPSGHRGNWNPGNAPDGIPFARNKSEDHPERCNGARPLHDRIRRHGVRQRRM
jgi:hypothetical protein